jgi:hypothetical protein
MRYSLPSLRLTPNDGGRGGPGWAMVHPTKKKKKKKKKEKKRKKVKFGSNFSHLVPSQKNVGPIFRFYDHIQ